MLLLLASSAALSMPLPSPPLAIIRIIPKSDTPYNELPFSEQDRVKITELVTFIAENNYVTLLLREAHLRHLGQQVNAVYPLKFLAFVTNSLKPQLRTIFEDSLKKGGFMTGRDGLSVNLDREAQKNTLTPYLHAFAEEVAVPASQLEPYFNSQDWEGLVTFLIYRP